VNRKLSGDGRHVYSREQLHPLDASSNLDQVFDKAEKENVSQT